MAQTLTVVAPAKVNLYLGVGGRRPDGYHDVVTVLQALELHDVLTLEPSDRLTVTCVPDLGLPPCDNSSAVAARVLGGILDREPGLAIHIEKRIPAGGGLGGGSSDAAATLAAMARLWGLADDDDRLVSAAAVVGADVPFFFGGGTALFAGRGDVLVRRLPAPALDVVLVNPGVPASTAVVYGALDRMSRSASPGPDQVLASLQSGDAAAIAAALHNDMADAAVATVPAVGEALGWIASQPGVLGSCVAGSGSTVFAICRDAAAADAVAADARARAWWATATHTRSSGVSIVDGARA